MASGPSGNSPTLTVMPASITPSAVEVADTDVPPTSAALSFWIDISTSDGGTACPESASIP